MQETNGFIQSLMALPKKPEFVGFTVDTDELIKSLIPIANEACGMDVEKYCSWDSNDEDNQLYFYIDEYALAEELTEEESEKFFNNLPFDIETPWEIAEYLMGKLYGVDTWCYATVRPWDRSITQVEIGIPRSL